MPNSNIKKFGSGWALSCMKKITTDVRKLLPKKVRLARYIPTSSPFPSISTFNHSCAQVTDKTRSIGKSKVVLVSPIQVLMPNLAPILVAFGHKRVGPKWVRR